MGYEGALLARDVGRERKELEKQATKADLYGSVGRTLATFFARQFLGPAADPAIEAAVVTGSALFGGAAGSKVAGPIPKGDFYQSSREELGRELKPFGAENVTGALTSGITAGMAQKLALGDEATTGGFDFYGSRIGQGPIGKWRMGRLGEERLSAWRAGGGTTDEEDFLAWLNE